MNNKPEKSPFSGKLVHVGVVVKDIDKVVERLESLGMGPFEPFDYDSLPPLIGKLLYRGKPYEAETKLLTGKMGDVKLELFEPVAGESPWQEFKDAKCEGIHHIAFLPDDLDRDTARFTEQGVSVLHGAKQENGGGSVYLDLGVGGLIFELEKLY